MRALNTLWPCKALALQGCSPLSCLPPLLLQAGLLVSWHDDVVAAGQPPCSGCLLGLCSSRGHILGCSMPEL